MLLSAVVSDQYPHHFLPSPLVPLPKFWK
jgi:hypothetical protein